MAVLIFSLIRQHLVNKGGNGGNVYVGEDLLSYLHINKRACTGYLNKGVKLGFYRKLRTGHYQLNSAYRVAPPECTKEGIPIPAFTCVKLNEWDLRQITWKNIILFRVLCILAVENDVIRTKENRINWIKLKEKREAIENDRLANPHGYSRPRNHRKRPPRTMLGEHPFACGYTATIVGLSKPTVYKYRAIHEQHQRDNKTCLFDQQFMGGCTTRYRTNRLAVGNLWDNSGWTLLKLYQTNEFLLENRDDLPVEEQGRYQYCTVTGTVWFNGCTTRISEEHRELKRKRIPTKYCLSNIHSITLPVQVGVTGEAEGVTIETDSSRTPY